MQTVTLDWRHYTIQDHRILSELRLAEENYSDKLFIHPPVFVYLSAALQYYGMPLALIPVFFFAVSVIFTVLLVCASELVDSSQIDFTVVWSVVLSSTCPIAFFCSQKFWIDNCLMMTVSISAFMHILLTKVAREKGICEGWSGYGKTHLCHFISGFIYGAVALNTKIAGLALLPFLLSWSCLQFLKFQLRIRADMKNNSLQDTSTDGTSTDGPKTRTEPPQVKLDEEENLAFCFTFKWRILINLAIYLIVFIGGVVLGHGPWVYYYKISTGRWLPNAWPSKSMLDRSPFLQLAISKPWHTYFLTLLEIAPVHLVGLFFASGLILTTVARAFILSTRGKKQQGAATLDSARGDSDLSSSSREVSNSTSPRLYTKFVAIAIFALWPFSFLLGLTALGVLGAGFQSRFLLPIVPATSILTAVACAYTFDGNLSVQRIRQIGLFSTLSLPLLSLLICISVMHSLFYGIMFYPFFADFNSGSVFRLLVGILQSPSYMPPTKETFDVILIFLKHYGIDF